jgi:23S rRNA (pseudouridine1915-N3)-methyltransferase
VRFKLISVGRKRADPASPLVDDYLARIAKFVSMNDLVLKPDSDQRIAARMLKESKKSTVLVALDERGKEHTSHSFAKLISSWMNDGVSEVTFFIGGADGLPKEILERATLRLALSQMTLPHRLARIVLTEQIYRAFCIVRGVPYQK